ncbi:gamma-glutamyltransferase family protein [Bordetella bronchiseptica]|uniref:Putative gamma-glutamyltranspeptidase n=1 Tax=Bordetella bronchiseptica 253 TaxID=568707 RepID=A0A0C6P917_BORBO|nr:gamma-glutamyltransferase family protein [Bordetella bronchiseptica]SHS67112.1 Gamma-glutamyl transferase [Mycobacteroides abscessus subsp. abscessus]AWP76751.1 gamma-glutamyltransferase [Bordetella bronchiseptica]AWP81600.1 gamma-glutamyltransferase [Bordetella bronchiseptica]AWP86393.1 gamma-glutamyltransferase [Bordetella bronchiseptica]AWQ11964.1 gamma-glutamyltransferase [Bordetella bronchiseptica]
MTAPLPLDWTFPYVSQRMPALGENMVCTEQPLANQAAMRMLAAGGNAVDAAIAAAITMTVVGPCMNGIGGDLFAIIWDGRQLHGLNASGRAPQAWTREYFSRHDAMPARGWDAVTVPGAVSGWVALSRKFGKLDFARLFEPALHYARHGFLVTPITARQWADQAEPIMQGPGFRDAFAPNGRTPQPGERFICPGQADTLQDIADTHGESFYRGALAARIAAFARETGGALTEADLAAHQADWVDPIGAQYGELTLHEIGPSGQGIGALMALGMLDGLSGKLGQPDSTDFYHYQIEAMKLAFADINRYVADPASMREVSAEMLLDRAYLATRAGAIDPAEARYPGPGKPHNGGTTYLTAADADGMMVSLIQSNFKGFGSGVVVPGTGIALHNRGWGFNLIEGHPNEVGPGKRPFHTIIPGFLMRDGEPLMSFGVMGGSLQAQGHVQVTVRTAAGQNPQAIVDAPRWRILEDNRTVMVEWNFPDAAVAGLRERGHAVTVAPRFSDEFGGSQAIMRIEGGYLGASDHRKDGQASAL